MPRRSNRKAAVASSAAVPARGDGDPLQEQRVRNPTIGNSIGNGGRSVAAHVRDRQRAVAEREASRLARPESRVRKVLGHADRKKSAVSSTPFGIFAKQEKEGGGEGADNAPQEWCGPFSVARQMIAKREEARRKREAELAEDASNGLSHPLDGAMEELDRERKRKAHPSLQWKPTWAHSNGTTIGSSLYAKRQKRLEVRSTGKAVPPLFRLCVKFLVDNFEHVERLGDVDNSIRTAIAKELVASSKMNGESFAAIAEPGIEALEMVDCAEVSQDQLSKSLKELLPAGLRYLVLDQAGRCFGRKAVEAIITALSDKSSSVGASLFALSIGGAYLLDDDDAARLVRCVAKTASSLEFKACPSLRTSFCRSIGEGFSSRGHGTLLELSLEDMSLDSECLNALVNKPEALQNLKSVSFRRVDGMDDSFVDRLLGICGGALEGLDLGRCYALTDSVLSSIRRHCPRLRALGLAEVKHLTAPGLEALFTHVPGMSPPPMLSSVDLSCCDHEAVTDEVIRLVTQAATKKRNDDDGDNDGIRGGGIDRLSLLGGIVSLDAQGSTVLTDAALEYLVDTSAKTLKRINLSFCVKVTDQGIGYLVDHVGSQLSKIEVWGCAQITDAFYDGHCRVNDGDLEIEGAWMKKSSGIRSVR